MRRGRPDKEHNPAHMRFSPVSLRWLGFGVLVAGGALILIALSQGAPWELLGLLAVVIVAGGAGAISASSGATRAASITFSASFMLAALSSMFLFGGVQTSSAVPLIAGVALCGVLHGRRGLLTAGVVGVAGVAVVSWGASAGWLLVALQPNTLLLAAGTVIGSIVMVCLVFLVGHRALDVTTAQSETARRRLAESGDVDPVSASLSAAALRRSIDGSLSDPDCRRDAALLVIGLNHGSLIRLGFGTNARDAVLRSVADRLRDLVRPHDLIGRVGEEEFAIFAPRVGDAANAIALAHRIVEQVESPVSIGDRALTLRVHIGVAVVSEAHESADRLLRDGHAATAAARNLHGRSIGVYEAGLVRQARHALELDERMSRAIADGLLVPWYQPIVSLVDGRLEGFEALVRWVEPSADVVHPGEFLPRAEATGVIVEIDRLVLRQACRQLANWGSTHPQTAPWVAVNLSAAQFETSDLVEVVAAALQETGIAPERLHLELTESALTVDITRTCEILSELKKLGVVLALDDFGTGWSSLRYIQSYPIDVVKIDRSFIKTIDESGGQELAATIIFMAKELGLALVGEGIETRTQYRVLRELGVHEGQGYHFSRPLPAGRAARYLRVWLPEEPSRPWDRSMLELVESIG